MQASLWCSPRCHDVGKIFFHSTHEQTKSLRHLTTSESDTWHDRWNWHGTRTLLFSTRTSFPSPCIDLPAEFYRLALILTSQNKWHHLLLHSKSWVSSWGFKAQVVEHADESPELQLDSGWEFRWRFREIGTNVTEKIDPLRKRACLQWWRVSCWLYTVGVELLTVLLVLTSVTNTPTITMAVVFIENLSLMPQLLETPPRHPSFDAIVPWGFKFNTWNFLRYHQFLESCQGFSGPMCYGFFLVCCSRFTNSTEFSVSTLHVTFCPNGSLYNSSYVFAFQKYIVDPRLLGGCWEERDSRTHLPTTGALTLSIQHP